MKPKSITNFLTLTILVVLLVFTNKLIYAQDKQATPIKQITVTGSAEMSIEPDEVEINVCIYTSRADLDKKESEFIEICKKHKIPDDQLAFKTSTNSWGGWYWNYWNYWWYYRHSSEIVQNYKLKVNSKINLLELVKDLNKNWVRDISVGTTSNKDITLYRKEVKKEAMRMAKEKASYLLEAIDESVGSVISVEELTPDSHKEANGRAYFDGWYWHNPYYANNSSSNSNMSSNSVMNSGGGTGNSSEDKLSGLSKIKIRFEVKAVFEIQ